MTSHSDRLETFSELSDIFPSLIPLKGKQPIEEGWQYYCENTRLYDERDFKGYNAGIPGGPANGVIVLDMDDREIFDAWSQQKGFELPIDTRIHRTGSGKYHYFYQYPNNGMRYGNRSLKSAGIDIRGIGGQVVGPGSIHPGTGKPYRVYHDLPVAPAPQWLPLSAGTLQGRKKLKAQRKALREEISHVQSLIRIAQEALEDGLYD